MRKEVSYASLHGMIHTATTGQMGVTLEAAGPNKPSKVLKMTTDDRFLYVEARADVRSKPVTIAVPLTNVSHLVFAKNEEDSKS